MEWPLKKTLFISIIASSLLADTKLLSQADANSMEFLFDSNKAVEKISKNIDDKSYKQYKNTISYYAKINGVKESILAAIIKVESNFDKFAVSNTDALGLMQVKLDQAVSDVYKSNYNRADLPNREQLFEPQINISIGSAYLALVSNKYFKDIKDPQTKEYCLIAAYNAGAGTVLRTFHDDKIEAQKIINGLSPEDVLEALKTKMASEQGRRYVQKVLIAKSEFEKEPKENVFEPNFLYVNSVLKQIKNESGFLKE